MTTIPIHTTGARVMAAEAAMAKAASSYLALGSGDVAWGNTPPSPSVNSTALVAEFCRRKANLVSFCQPDSNGSISLPEGKFSTTNTPTNFVYYRINFEFEDAIGSTIRELGMFADTVPVAGTPPGQYLLTPSEVATAGRLLAVARRPPLLREVTIRELFELVVTF